MPEIMLFASQLRLDPIYVNVVQSGSWDPPKKVLILAIMKAVMTSRHFPFLIMSIVLISII